MKRRRFTCGVLLVSLFMCFWMPGAVLGADAYKIGLILTTTGPYAGMGSGQKFGAELAAQSINEAGGIQGRKIELIFEDDEGDAGKGSNAIRKLISVNKVPAVYGTSSNLVSHTISLIAEDMKIPIVSPVPSAKYTIGKKFAFSNIVNEHSLIEFVGRYMHETKKWKKVGILHDATEYGMDYSSNLEKWLTPKGMKVVRSKFAPGATDVTPQWLTLKNENLEGLFLVAGPPNAAAIAMKNRKQLGLTIPVIGSSSLNMPKFLELAGEAAEGMLMSTYLHYGKWTSGQQLMIDYMKKKAPDVFPTLFHALGWDGIYLIARAIEKGGDSPLKIRDALEQTHFKGAVGEYNMGPDDHNGLSVKALCMVQVKDGKFLLYEK